jgi:hypothetical protein
MVKLSKNTSQPFEAKEKLSKRALFSEIASYHSPFREKKRNLYK